MSAVQTAPPQPVPRDDPTVEIERALGWYLGRTCRIASIARRPSVYRTSFALDEVDVVLDDGRPFQLVIKHLGDGALSALARRAKPGFLADPRREIDTYLGILMPARLGTPICYGAAVDPIAGRSRLILERVPGSTRSALTASGVRLRGGLPDSTRNSPAMAPDRRPDRRRRCSRTIGTSTEFGRAAPARSPERERRPFAAGSRGWLSATNRSSSGSHRFRRP
jgi:hypothetical protein